MSSQLGGADVAYVLMFPGWDSELRANRWHWVRRLTAVLPTVLVQPVRVLPDQHVRATLETRFANAEILEIVTTRSGSGAIADGLAQAGQILLHQQSRGFARPFIWLYNPRLVHAAAALPAVGRVTHATEDFFRLPAANDEMRSELAHAAEISDLVVAVSEGVARSIRDRVPSAHVLVATNGCDADAFASASPDAEILDVRGHFARVAAYAGSIDYRLDLELVGRAADAVESTLFAFAGPVRDLGRAERRVWQRLIRRPNVRWFGLIDPDRLPGFYAAADLGIAPYKSEAWLVESGFPLKVLEMAASGLPVVSTSFDSLSGLARAILVTHSSADFVLAVASVDRSALGPAQRAELAAVCLDRDYDRSFGRVLLDLQRRLRSPADLSAPAAGETGLDAWRRICLGVATRRVSPTDRARVVFAPVASLLARRLPVGVRSHVPEWIRSALKRGIPVR